MDQGHSSNIIDAIQEKISGRRRPEETPFSTSVPFGKQIADFSTAEIITEASGYLNRLKQGRIVQKRIIVRSGATLDLTDDCVSRFVQNCIYIEGGGKLQVGGGLTRHAFVQNKIVARSGSTIAIAEDLGIQNRIYIEDGANIYPDLRDLFGAINVHSLHTADLDKIILPREMIQIPVIEHVGKVEATPSAPPVESNDLCGEFGEGIFRGRAISRSGAEGDGSAGKVKASSPTLASPENAMTGDTSEPIESISVPHTKVPTEKISGRRRPEETPFSTSVPFGKQIADFSTAEIITEASGYLNRLKQGRIVQKRIIVRSGATLDLTDDCVSRFVQNCIYIEGGGKLQVGGGLTRHAFVQNKIVARSGSTIAIAEDLGIQNRIYIEDGANIYPDLRDLFGAINVHSLHTADLDKIILPREMIQIPVIEHVGKVEATPSAPPVESNDLCGEFGEGIFRGRAISRSGAEGEGSVHCVHASSIRALPEAVVISSISVDIPIAEVLTELTPATPSCSESVEEESHCVKPMDKC